MTNKLYFRSIACIIFLLVDRRVTAQICGGSWELQRPLTSQCVVGQWIGWQNPVGDPPGCPTIPVYVGTQTNTFTFTNPVSQFSIDFRGFDASPGCARIELRINGIFYPLTAANFFDLPIGTTCTSGAFTNMELTPDGYLTNSPTGGPGHTGWGRVIINNVNATSVTVSANDGSGTVFSNPFNCTTLVPLKLETFTGNSNIACGIMLNWKTGQESNIKNIEIQSSEDGILFHKVGEVNSKGSNSQYSFIIPNSTNDYFRLKINDLDGIYEYSQILFIKSSCNKSFYAVVPNPASNCVEIVGLKNSDQTMIFDMMGKRVKLFNTPQNNKLNIQFLPKGIYFLKIINAGTTRAVLKVVKQ